MKIRVYHKPFGCDTGCCGHVVELEDGREEFEFTHPDQSGKSIEKDREWAKELATEIIARKWPECLESIDWASMEIALLDD